MKEDLAKLFDDLTRAGIANDDGGSERLAAYVTKIARDAETIGDVATALKVRLGLTMFAAAAKTIFNAQKNDGAKLEDIIVALADAFALIFVFSVGKHPQLQLAELAKQFMVVFAESVDEIDKARRN